MRRFAGKKLNGVVPRKHAFLALDIEDNPYTKEFICAGVVGKVKDHHGKQHEINEFFDNREKLNEFLLQKAKAGGKEHTPFILVGYNIDYDRPYIDDIIDSKRTLRTGSRLITGRIKDSAVKIIDLMNITGSRGSESKYESNKLEDWINNLDMEERYGITKYPVTSFTKENILELKKRVMSDAAATYHLARFIEDFFTDKGHIPMKSTISSASLEIWERNFASALWIRDNEFIDKYVRKSYRGGRCEVFLRDEHTVIQFDFHKMYLSILAREDFPNPMSFRYVPNNAGFREVWYSKKLFIADVNVFIPIQKIAPLPYMKGKILFPWGKIRGHFTSVELKFAVKNCGVKIEKVNSYVVYSEKHKYFKTFGEWVWKEISKYKKENNDGMVRMLKNVGNSLYGKFGEQYGGSGTWKRSTDIKEPKIPYEMRERDGIVFVRVPEPIRPTIHTFPEISSFGI